MESEWLAWSSWAGGAVLYSSPCASFHMRDWLAPSLAHSTHSRTQPPHMRSSLTEMLSTPYLCLDQWTPGPTKCGPDGTWEVTVIRSLWASGSGPWSEQLLVGKCLPISHWANLLPSYNGMEAGWGKGVQGRLSHLWVLLSAPQPDAHTPKWSSAASSCQDSQACFLLELEEMLSDTLPCLTLEGARAQGLGGWGWWVRKGWVRLAAPPHPSPRTSLRGRAVEQKGQSERASVLGGVNSVCQGRMPLCGGASLLAPTKIDEMM